MHSTTSKRRRTGQPAGKVQQVSRDLGVRDFYVKQIGSQNARRKGEDAPETVMFEAGLRLLRQVSHAVCQLISPVHHEKMWEQLLQHRKRKSPHPPREDRLVKTLVDMNIASPQGSFTFRVTRAVLFQALTAKERQDLRTQYPGLCAFDSESQKDIDNDLKTILGKMPRDVAALVTQLVEDTPDIKPAAALRRVLEVFPDLDDLWHEKVKTKTSALKTKAKAQVSRP